MEEIVSNSNVVIEFFPTLLHLAVVRKAKQLRKDFDFEILKEEYKNIQEGRLIPWSKIYNDSRIKEIDLEILKCIKARGEYKMERGKIKSQTVKLKRELKNREEALKNREALENREEALKNLEEALKNTGEALENREKDLKNRKLLKSRIKVLKNLEKALKKRRKVLIKGMLKYIGANPLTKLYRTQQNILMIPPHLRNRVMEAVQGLICSERQWKDDHSRILELERVNCTFYTKSDGRIDGIETAQKMVLNSYIDVRKRFLLACTYCFEENIKALWEKMRVRGQNENFQTANNSIVQFWIKRMSQGSQGPWIQELCTYLHFYPQFTIQRYSSFFPLLPPQQRRKFFSTLQFAHSDDLLLCMRAMTEEEQEKIITLCPEKVLHCYLQWPLRRFFLEVVENVWRYVDDFCLHVLLDSIFDIREHDKFDDSEIFEDFWKNIPDDLREELHPETRAKGDSILDEIERKRQALFEELRNSFHTKQN